MAGPEDWPAGDTLGLIESLLALPIRPDQTFERVLVADWDWGAVRIYLPQPDIQSAITPPFMEAFLTLQKQIYQLAAVARRDLLMSDSSMMPNETSCFST
jgi:hypothetical protein